MSGLIVRIKTNVILLILADVIFIREILYFQYFYKIKIEFEKKENRKSK